MKKNLLIIFGGASSEHKVSCLSAAAVLRNLDEKKYKIYKVGITREGNWLLTDSSVLDIEKGRWEKNPNNKKAALLPDAFVKGLIIYGNTRYKIFKIDVVFPVLHGKYGEDGTIQGLLELSGIPFVGSGTVSSAICMDKAITKLIINSTHIRQAKYYLEDWFSFKENSQKELREIEAYFKKKYPLFVKPANAGSSVGVSKVGNRDELYVAINSASNEDYKILIEEAIFGREIEVAVLGNRFPKASLIGEIVTANEFYDYEAKYISPKSKTRILVDVSETKMNEIQQAAITVYQALGCTGMARIDFFLDKEENLIFNEVNTLPGFTKNSMYPKLWEKTGLKYCELLDKLINLAVDQIL